MVGVQESSVRGRIVFRMSDDNKVAQFAASNPVTVRGLDQCVLDSTPPKMSLSTASSIRAGCLNHESTRIDTNDEHFNSCPFCSFVVPGLEYGLR